MRTADRAMSSIIGFVVAIGLFTVTFYYLTQSTVNRDGDTSVGDHANLDTKAAALAAAIGAPGRGWYSVETPCIGTGDDRRLDPAFFDPDGVGRSADGTSGRFGIGEETCLRDVSDPKAQNNVSYDKITNLYHAAHQSDGTNGYVDYLEAKDSLGLTEEALDFHLRSWPLLSSVREILARGHRDVLARPLYVGDYVETSGVERSVQHSWSIVDASDRVTVRLSITNNGTSATIFAVLFEIPLDKNAVGFTLHTPLLAPSASQEIQFTLRKSADWQWDDPAAQWITFDIQDRDGSIDEGQISLSGVSMTQLLTQTTVLVEAENMYWIRDALGSVPVSLNYMAFQGDGTKKKFSDWAFLATTPLGVPLTSTTLPNNVFDGEVSFPAVLDGAYKGEVRNDLLTSTWNIDYLNVVPTEISSFTSAATSGYSPTPAVAEEGRYVAALVEEFQPGVFSAAFDHVLVPYVAGGDIYPDLKHSMNTDLVDALTKPDGTPEYTYNLLIVGSNVDHRAMTSASAKYAIRDWVLGGGTMMVFGSDQQSIQWLQPLFHASLETANGGLYTPDQDHPVLHVPNQLDYQSYEYSTQWGYNAGADASFTHVVATEGGGDVMAVGNPGAFGSGRVLLSSWRPYALGPDQAERCPAVLGPEDHCESLFLMHNMMTIAYRYLYLDYGPPMPEQANSGAFLKIMNVYHPEVEQMIALHMQVFVFD
jgi:hypothetical protein